MGIGRGLPASDRSGSFVWIEAERGERIGRKRHTAEQITRKLREAEVEERKLSETGQDRMPLSALRRVLESAPNWGRLPG
jgi:hypothetical protein